jgi:hypothetical protein
MSDELNTASTPDVSAAASTGDVSVASTPDVSTPSPDPFAGLDVEGMFGLKSSGQDEQPTPDVTKVADPPAPHQSENVAEKQSTEKAAEQPASPDVSQTDSQSEAGKFQENDKIDWKSAPEQFRNQYTELKKFADTLAASSVEGQYLTEPDKFAEWMKETSPTSYNEIGGLLATESAQAHPDKWIDFLATDPANADRMAEKISGREGMTVERLKAELSVILDDDDPDVQAAIEAQKQQKPAQPVETQEQKRIRELLARDEQQQEQERVSQVFDPIEKEVNSLISEAGLEVDLDAIKGKSYADLDGETKFKVMVNQMMPHLIEQGVQSDPRLANIQARINEFLKKGDVKSALNLQHPAKIAVTNIVREALEVFTGQQAKAAQAKTLPPATDTPPPIVKGAGAAQLGAGNGNKPVTDDDWNVTASDFRR